MFQQHEVGLWSNSYDDGPLLDTVFEEGLGFVWRSCFRCDGFWPIVFFGEIVQRVPEVTGSDRRTIV